MQIIPDFEDQNNTPDEPQSGLVLPAISGETFSIYNISPHATITAYSDLMECAIIRKPREKQVTIHEGTKKPITTFTAKARRTMFRKMGKIRDLHSSYFVTLTYPGLFDFTPDEVKAHFNAFKKRFFYRHEKAGFVWRLELKQRQSGASEGRLAPHFHLLIMKRNAGSFEALKDEISKNWFEVVTDKNQRWTPEALDHFKAGTQVKPMHSRREAISYVSKYIGKVEEVQMHEEDLSHWGRFWGVCGEIDYRPMFRIEIDRPQYVEIRREIAKAMNARERKKRFDRQGNPLPPKRGFARRLRRGGTMVGFAALGYGDQSEQIKHWQKSLIWLICTRNQTAYDPREIAQNRRASLQRQDEIARQLKAAYDPR